MKTAKLFKKGRSQAVRVTGDVIPNTRNRKFAEWLKLRDKLIAEAPQEFEDFEMLRDQGPHVERDWP